MLQVHFLVLNPGRLRLSCMVHQVRLTCGLALSGAADGNGGLRGWTRQLGLRCASDAEARTVVNGVVATQVIHVT